MKIQLAITLLAASVLQGQASKPDWEEFSIGPPTENRTANPKDGIRSTGTSVKHILARAYGVQENRIFGPTWIADERYSLTAMVSDPKDFQPFMQQELATRFHLSAHREAKQAPVFVLKSLNGSTRPAEPAESSGFTGFPTGASTNGSIVMHCSVAQFVDWLGNAVGRPVLDETHMSGSFDFNLKWRPGSNPSLQKAVKDQLGLQLSDERRVVDLVIIDHIEKLQFPK